MAVGETSSPITTRVGFHLFFLEDRAGEKIKLQQLFLPLGDVLVDVAPAVEKQKELLPQIFSMQYLDIIGHQEQYMIITEAIMEPSGHLLHLTS